MCLPIASTVTEVIQSADQQCIVGLLAKMGVFEIFSFNLDSDVFNEFVILLWLAVDRSLSSSITDARDALINACVEVITSYKATLGSNVPGLVVPGNLRLMPLYVAALLKSVSFKTNSVVSCILLIALLQLLEWMSHISSERCFKYLIQLCDNRLP